LSERGNVTIDDRTNTLLVMDTARKIDDIRAMMRILDIPVRQVLIESRIVTATDKFSRELGAKFGLSDKNSQSGFAGSLDGAVSMAGTGTAPTSQRLNYNNPVGSSTAGRIGFNISRLVDGTILDLELSALEAENNGEVIASPRVVTANQREAFIEDGVEIPYLQASSAGATNVQFKKAVLSLKVKPQITPDERIMMDLSVTQDTVGEVFAGIPSIKTQEVGTQLLVNNGETVVLGGVYKQAVGTDVSKIPLLGDIPGLGWLFRNKIDRNEKQELLIFVTPKILKDNTTR
jgi:type IV pilus assembly protein PilQ